jgi:peptidyl-prolyl cis-trans isomerase B (cyclophilin B)
MKRPFLPPAICFLLAVTLLAGLAIADPSPSPSATPATDTLSDIQIVIHTNKGEIAALLFASKAPLAVASFLHLAEHKFFDNLKFHRVIHGFMIQGGDPDGNGEGGPGYEFKDEINKDLKFDKAGVLAMANHGQNTNGSQFFITHVPTPHLDGHFSIFGQVTAGQPTVDQIEQGDTIESIQIMGPTEPLFTAEAAQIAQWDAALKERAAKSTPSPK